MSRPSWKTVLLSVGLFLFFLILQFPYQNFKGWIFGKIYSATHILIVASDIYPALFGWPGVAVKDVDLSVPLGPNELELSAGKLVVRLGVGGLIPPVPAYSLAMKDLKKGGDLYFKFSDSSGATKASAEADEVELEQIAFSGLPEPLKGKLTLDGDLYLDKAELSRSSGSADLEVDKLKIPAQNLQGFVLPALSLGTLKSKLRVKNGMADIQSFQFGGNGADLSGSVSGDIRLGKDMMSSFLNVTLRLQVAEGYRKNSQAALLLSLLDSFRTKKDGDYAMKWSASIHDMTTNLMSAIPQKVAD